MFNTINGTNNADFIAGTIGDDVVFGGGGNDIIITGPGNDIVFGGDGNDWIQGQDGDDVLVGDAGNDVIAGGSGNDILSGGSGDDSLIGEAGDDFFYFNDETENVVIADFTDGEDRMYFYKVPGVTDFDDLTFTDVGDDVVITVDGNPDLEITLWNVEISDLDDPNSYLFA